MATVSVPMDLARDIRIMKGLSQVEAGQRFNGVSAATVSAVETGQRNDLYAEYVLSISAAPNKSHRTPGGTHRVGRKRG